MNKKRTNTPIHADTYVCTHFSIALTEIGRMKWDDFNWVAYTYAKLVNHIVAYFKKADIFSMPSPFFVVEQQLFLPKPVLTSFYTDSIDSIACSCI